MNSPAVTIERWAAWAPGVETPAQWDSWARGDIKISQAGMPDVEFLPSLFRRRLSRLSRMALRVAYNCLGAEHPPVRSVFCSRHGELSRTAELLNSITRTEALSPTAFSMSVHNTASGLYSIARQDKSASSAIASGIDSLESGFLDAAAALHAGPRDERLMLVIADEEPPEPFGYIAGENGPAYAAAFLLTKTESGNGISLAITGGRDESAEPREDEPHALSLLRFLINGGRELALKTDRLVWMWRNHAKQN
ncbi:MAG TPA: beta-ketoacyl synthase chain length factor [Gammaproteobacteria bacterium]|nr:beta-ketoacyl synthase chain length factor [Gammaproteobacteria bacterium]